METRRAAILLGLVLFGASISIALLQEKGALRSRFQEPAEAGSSGQAQTPSRTTTTTIYAYFGEGAFSWRPTATSVSTITAQQTPTPTSASTTTTQQPRPWFDLLSDSSPSELMGSQESLSIVDGRESASDTIQAVCLETYYGGFGNQMMMLRVAVETARRLRVSYVRLPSMRTDPYRTTLREVLNLEDVWHLGTRPHTVNIPRKLVKCAAKCTEWAKCELPNRTMIDWMAPKTPEIWRKLISKAGRLRCNELATFRKGGEDTLTMHMRSRDVLKELSGWFGYQKIAPCDFWLQALQRGSYSAALIITEADLQHPCIGVVNSTFTGKVTVQTSGFFEDFCSLMHSRDIAFGISTLGVTVLELSLVARTVYVPEWWQKKLLEASKLLQKCVVAYFPGYPESFANWTQKRDYVLSYPASRISLQEQRCFR